MDETQNSVSYQSLADKFELTKKELGAAEETIRRITGREADTFYAGAPGFQKWKLQQGAAQGRMPVPGARKRPLFPIIKSADGEPMPGNEESPDEDEAPVKRHSLQSTVVASTKDTRSKRDTIQGQNVNSKVKARNRRMFGMILGTLQKFQSEESKRKEQDTKRAVIEQKVEAAAAEEKEQIKKEKEELFLTRKEKQLQLRCLEKKMEIAQFHEIWERNQKSMINFIKTEASPPVFFLPANHNKKTLKMVEESRAKGLELIQQKKEETEKALLEVEDWYKKDNFPSDKENMGPFEEDQSEEGLVPSQEPHDEDAAINTNTVLDNNEPTSVKDTDVEIDMVPESNTQKDNDNVLNDEERTCDTNEENETTLVDQEFEPIYD